MKKVLVIDNHDSFVYNLVHYLEELGAETLVISNDELSEAECVEVITKKIKPSHILVSPGPGRPKDSGISLKIIQEFKGNLPILGVCLGMQAIGELHGAELVYAPKLMHGKTSEIKICGTHRLFAGISGSYTATRYHSLVLDRASVLASNDLVIEAEAVDDQTVMAISCTRFPDLVGVQYHPESILSDYGHRLLQNFLDMVIL